MSIVKPKISISWSGGKDSTLALQKVIDANEFEIDHLHTVIDRETRRVGLHGVREELIEKQAASLNIPLKKLYLEASNNHSNYEKLLKGYYKTLNQKEITSVLFGDIFLEDLKAYRDKMLGEYGLTGIYPLWQSDTGELLEEFIDQGFKTLICAANKEFFSEKQIGDTLGAEFKTQLHEKVDPCGENGEFHTFVYDGPIFNNAIVVEKKEIIEKTYTYNKQGEDGELTKLETTFLFQELI